MSDYYKGKRSRNLFDPSSDEPFKLSRSKIDLFLQCPRCFYYDRRLGVSQPPGYPFSLNSAVDKLLKKEFDDHRIKGLAHPLMKAYGIDAIPFHHPDMDKWRDSLHAGISYLHPMTNLLITGGVDDVWQKPNGELIIVDYKATAKDGEVTLDAEWQDGYKRQMEVYQWLFRKNGFKVADIGFFVYCNGDMDKEAFDGKLEFRIKLIPYKGNDSWVEPTIYKIFQTLTSNFPPESSVSCDYCNYRKAVQDIEKPLRVE